MSALIQRLLAPYPCFKLAPWRWTTPIYMGLAIILIVAVLFLNGYPGISWGYRFWFGTIFGLLSMATIVSVHLLGLGLVGQSLARRWTVIHEIGWIAFNFLIIGIANMLLLRYLEIADWGWASFFTTAGVTVMIGLPPLLILILFRQNQLLKKHLQLAAEINAQERSTNRTTTRLAADTTGSAESVPPAEVQKIRLDRQEIELEQLLFLEANRNYLRIVCRGQTEIQQARLTMQAADNQLAAHPQLIRCHRAFLVNLDRVTGLSGNSQGLLLEMDGSEEQVPVSRTYVERVRAALLH